MNVEMKDAIPCNADEVEKMKDMENKIPLYPEPLLEKNDEHDIPGYVGDLDDLTERRNVKLYNVWSIWSDLRRNEKLITMLEAQKKDSKDTMFFKAMLTLTIDRLGKVLSDTNIVEELCVKNSKRSESDIPRVDT